MNLAASILGSNAVEKLKETRRAFVLEVGSDKLTRGQLSRVECFNFLAARNLTSILKELGVRNLRQVYDEIPPSALALPHMGVVSLAVLGAAFEAKGIGGDAPLESYVKKHSAEKNGKSDIVTFFTLKHREQAEVSKERRERKQRRKQRRNQAHALRTERFEKRAEAQ